MKYRLRSVRIAIASGAVVCLMLAARSTVVNGQGSGEPTPDSVAGPLVGACHASPIVENLDVSARFYHHLLGLNVYPPLEDSGPFPWDTAAGHLDIHGTPEARLRFTGARMPNVWCGVEIVEFGDIERTAVHRGVQDPGTATLIVLVRDIDAVFARVLQAGTPVVTTGGTPIPVGPGRTRAVIVRDPDGHFVELVQLDPAPTTTVSPSSNVIGMHLRLAVADLDQALPLYRRLFGGDLRAGAFRRDGAMAALLGLPEVEFRSAAVEVPHRLNSTDASGLTLRVEFMEFKTDATRPLVRSRVQDPGSYRLLVHVRDLDAAIAAVETAGTEIISTSGVPVTMGFGARPWRLVAFPDANNLFLVVMQGPAR